MRQITWIGGWGVPPDWLATEFERVMPQWRHVVLPPTSNAFADARWKDAAWIGGYSLGAFLLLKANQQQPIAGPAILLAPFFAYPSDQDKGGRVRRGQLRFLRRWMGSDPEAALRDFYERSGLPIPETFRELPYSMDDLLWGLSVLENEEVPSQIPPDWRAVCGAEDPLLDAEKIKHLAPAVRIVEEAGHAPAPLLRAFDDFKT